jgi:hypothetical protein
MNHLSNINVLEDVIQNLRLHAYETTAANNVVTDASM